jgi:DNA repair protein RecN (Recombination protein N)
MDIEPEDGLVILSRKITPQRAIGRINGETVSVSRMKEAASLLIDLYGQHEHQSLLSKKKHLEILDDYAKERIAGKKETLVAEYRKYRKLQEEWKSANLDTAEQKRELSLLEYEVNEIEEASLVTGEDEELEAAFRKFSNGKKIMEAANGAYAATGEGRENAAELIGRALRELSSVSQYDGKLEEMEQELSEIDNLLGDFNHEISGYLAGEEFDEEQFYETEKRLDLINHLKSKYGSTVEEILASCKLKSERISQLMDYDNYLNQLLTSIKNQEQLLEQLSTELSEIRKEEALKLTGAIRDALVDLNFLDVRFSMEFERTPDYTAGGIDDAQFLISTNPGEPEKPLGKVASGGELSRIMLAIKTVMAENDDMDTLIFDEIDSGISGRTAQKVSEKMNLLGRHHQIICITHLPQIAAMADTHFLIEKSVQNQSTVSRIEKLSETESINELARMLGGVEITDTVYQNAKEMKEMAHMKK